MSDLKTLTGAVLSVGPDGKATLVPAEPSRILKPEVAVEAERQKELAKQRMHRQVALEMYCAEIQGNSLSAGALRRYQREAVLDECIELAGYLIEKTGGHQ